MVITFLVLLCSLTVHEAAHAWSADRLGDPTARLLGRLSFNPLVHADLVGTVLLPLMAIASGLPIIGWAKPVPVNVSRLRHGRRDFVLVSAAGPASNFLIALVAAAGIKALRTLATPDALSAMMPLARMLPGALFVNLLLAFFNMIPVPPLDGGNVVSGLLSNNGARLFDRLRPYGFLLIYAVVLTPVFDYVVARPAMFFFSLLT
ncbi:MAG: site-2 protease family protein [Acidobacteriaceae bacterium]|nr:site-2 protease family protein [Acidobacteriaceae bacterium]